MEALNLLFEPAGLGDAVIAARMAGGAILQIQERWHPVVKALYPSLTLRSILLPHALGDHRFGTFRRALCDLPPDEDFTGRVLSVRGDLRDRLAARRLYPRASLRFVGWSGWAATHSAVVNGLFKLLRVPVRNRYAQWARAIGIPPPPPVPPEPAPIRKIAIHTGAQWGSRRYPWVADLVPSLREAGVQVRVMAGPGDAPLKDVVADRVEGAVLVGELREVDLVICNDSAPMHIAAALGKRVAVFSAISDIRQWIPPGDVLVLDRRDRRGYRPDRRYKSHEIIVDAEYWPSPSDSLAAIQGRWRLIR